MASYFEDLNIRKEDSRPRNRYNVDLDDFMTPASSSGADRQHPTRGDASDQLQQMLNTANFLNQFRAQMQAGGDRDQEHFLDDLVAQIMEESQGDVKGPPPASERFISLLPRIKSAQLKEDETCIICKDNLTESASATKMPCGHYFDKDCLVPWLRLHNTCPLCRHEVETEQQVKEEEEEEARDMMYG